MIMESYGIPPKVVEMVKAMYDDSQCAVVDDVGQTDWFDVLACDRLDHEKSSRGC